jgi:FAD/FMN-containing dehydrogenase
VDEMAIGWQKEALQRLGGERMLLAFDSRSKLSKDHYWFSPILENKLKDKIADGIALPVNEAEIIDLLKFSYDERVPVTVRGAGTGNYGQAIPLQGGLILDVSGLDQILEWGQGFVRVQPGVILGDLEREARMRGQELRVYPSNYKQATVGGFVCGGTIGVGSINWGHMWDGNVQEITVLTLEKEPKKLVVKGDSLLDYIHNYGTTGILTELVLLLTPKTEWQQVIVSFSQYANAMLFADSLTRDNSLRKRLISLVEWPIPSFFQPLARWVQVGKAAVILEIEEVSLTEAYTYARRHKGEIAHLIPAIQYREGVELSDFTWNHTTYWAIQEDPAYTYLQAAFLSSRFLEQAARIKIEYHDEVLLHHEWSRTRGVIIPQSIPLVKFTTESRLYEIIIFCHSIGVSVHDPHTYLLESGGRGSIQSMITKKRENDPRGLLNPGKIQYM